jgi:hypothetical protein
VAQQLVLVVGAAGGHGDDVVERREHGLHVELGDVRHIAVDALGHEVPVVVERRSHVLQVVEPGAGREEQPDRAFHGRLVEQPVHLGLPAGVEADLRGDLVQHRDPGWEPGLDGVLVEDALSEGVQRPDGGSVEHRERLAAGVARAGPLVELAADPVGQLGGRLLREGDGGDVVGGHAGLDQGHEPVDEALRLARAGAGLEEDRPVEVAHHGPASAFVGEHVNERHRAPPARPARGSAGAPGLRAWRSTPAGARNR